MTARGHIILKDVKDRVLLGLWTCRVGLWDCDCLAGLFVYASCSLEVPVASRHAQALQAWLFRKRHPGAMVFLHGLTKQKIGVFGREPAWEVAIDLC